MIFAKLLTRFAYRVFAVAFAGSMKFTFSSSTATNRINAVFFDNVMFAFRLSWPFSFYLFY